MGFVARFCAISSAYFLARGSCEMLADSFAGEGGAIFAVALFWLDRVVDESFNAVGAGICGALGVGGWRLGMT